MTTKRQKTGGRQKGTPNKATAKREAEIADAGITPLEYMLTVLHDETATAEDRKWAATAAAPYVHPKLASHHHAIVETVPMKDRLERAKARLMPRLELVSEAVEE